MTEWQHFILGMIISEIIFHCVVKHAGFFKEETEEAENSVDRFFSKWL
jgi:hypothetical protein